MFCHPLPRNRACRESRGAAGFVVVIRRVLCRYGIPSRRHATLVIFLDNDRDVAALLLPIRPQPCQCRQRRLLMLVWLSVSVEAFADAEVTVSVGGRGPGLGRWRVGDAGELSGFPGLRLFSPYPAWEFTGIRRPRGYCPNGNVGNPRFLKNAPETADGRKP